MNQPLRGCYVFGEFRLEGAERQLLRGGKPIALPPKILDTLLLLVENAGHLIEKDLFMKTLWPDTFVGEDALARNISVLRKTLGESSDSQAFIVTVPTHGYRFVAPVQRLNELESRAFEKQPPKQTDSSEEAVSATENLNVRACQHDVLPTVGSGVLMPSKPVVQHGNRQKISASLLVGFALLVLMFLAPAGYFAWQHFRSRATPPAKKVMLAVLPFQNLTGDPGQDYFSDGFTEEMITVLGALQPEQLGVIARTSVMQYKHSDKPVAQIASQLGVQYLLEGSVRSESGRIRVSAQLIRADDQTHLWAANYQRDIQDVLDVQNDVAEAIAGQIRLRLTDPEKARLASARSVNPQAHEAYLMSRFYWNRRTHADLTTGFDYFRKAVALDPTDPLGYSGIADSYFAMGADEWLAPGEAFPLAKEAELKALALDDTMADGHSTLGQIYQWERDWARAERECKRALALNPNSAVPHQRCSLLLSKLGRLEEGVTEARRAREFDPLSTRMNITLGQALYLSRRYDEAQQAYLKNIELDPNAFQTYERLASVHAQQGQFEDSIEALQKAAKLSADNVTIQAQLAYAYAKLGKTREAELLLRQLKDKSRSQYVSGFHVSLICIGLGRKDEAFQWLERAYEQRDYQLTWLGVEPLFDPLRSDPRFQNLLRRIGLPQ